MNSTQRRVILLGFVVILVMGLFPPWRKTLLEHPQTGSVNLTYMRTGEFYSYEMHDGYKLLSQPRHEEDHGGLNTFHQRVDTSLLLCQWFLVSAVTGIIVMFLGDRR